MHMAQNENIRKNYKLQKNTIDKIKKLKSVVESENPQIKIYEKDVVVQAVDLLFSSKFGKDVFDQTISRLETVLGNMMKATLNEYVINFANTFENIYTQNEQNKEMLLLILKANEILPNSQQEINSLIMMNEKIENFIKEAVLLKMEMNK